MVAFRCYDPSANGRGGVHAWYNSLSPEFRAEIDSAMELLGLEDSLDDVPEIKPLRGVCEGLTEIKIDFRLGETEVHLRILGFVGPGRMSSLCLLVSEKRRATLFTALNAQKLTNEKTE
jgi:hypothetical protein